MKKTMIIMLAAFCGLMNARAGDLTTDNLTVNKDAKFYGKIEIVKLGTEDPSTNGLVLFYNFQTNATPVQDQSGNGYTATVYGATWTNDGKLNGCCLFDGVNDYIATSLTNLGGSEITIAYWFKGADIRSAVRQQKNGGSDYVISGWYGGSTNQLHILSNDGGTGAGLHVDGNKGATINDGSWHHVAMTWKQNTANGFVSYLDGTQILARTSANTAISNIGTPVELGRYQGGGSEYLNGRLDELRIYNRALTNSEIWYLYGAGMTSSNSGNFAALSVTASNSINQTSASGTNIFMGKVGIGTANPSVQLDVAGDVAVSGNITLPGGATGTLCYLKCDYIYDWAGTTLGIDNHSFRLMSAGVPTVQWDAGILSCKDWRVDNTATGGQEIVNYETMTNYLSSTYMTNNPSDIPMGTYTNQ